ncbi:mechanosensitive ion channel family protein [Candidatus Schmidhempelia bombi]|uniref:Mechanosensitive ion channel n=1 Tax=Candidatus Schmidhempelia bombi str. Bimp TaxID=1387197 RepID=A0AB94IEF7_9GAMM|nr:mechanosensitive ion channel domain-containing protein [Candidatus Schmidhempelia bombi]TEA27849.1 mechanosensitive ion channel [Candidatus Schmidhempelia bombi str. Bimp]
MTNHILELYRLIHQVLNRLAIPAHWTNFTTMLLLVITVVLFSILFQKIANKMVWLILNKADTQLHTAFFRAILKYRVVQWVILLFTITVIENLIPFIFLDYPDFVFFSQHLLDITIIYVSLKLLLVCLYALSEILRQRDEFTTLPFNSYLQVIKIILLCVGILFAFSILTNRSLWSVVTALGAISAILMLIFKDSIMGFVGSVQITTNDLIRIGDWITVSQYNANGIVKDITLTSVKIMNYDNTLTSVPTYSLASGAFQNWRTMQESGCRRFNRTMILVSRDIRFLNDTDLEKYKTIGGVSDYLTQFRQQQQNNLAINDGRMISPFQVTNFDIFMAYARWYLKHHLAIDSSQTILVRQLDITSTGIKIEILAFTRTTNGIEYESILAEVMNHLLASVSFFDIRIYEINGKVD